MRISIAMATYNGSAYLKAQLQSFVNQAHLPDELVITDDCSTDETESIVREFAKTAPFNVEFYRNEQNLGYCGNFNAALMKTSGDLVFLSDQDDVWYPEKIEHILEIAKCNPEALLIMNDAALTNSELGDVGLTKLGQIRSAGLSLEAFVMGCCCAIKRELLDLCTPIPAGAGHDTWLVWLADGLGSRIVDDRVLQYYRRHESNASVSLTSWTTRVNRIQVLHYRVKKVLFKDKANSAGLHLEQLRIFTRGLREISATADEKYKDRLLQLQCSTENKIRMIESRMAIREKQFLQRVIAAARLWRRGGYRDASCFKAIIRDLFFG